MDEDQTMSPEATHKLLNPYLASAEQRNSRLSSVNRQMKSTSPANIKLEPVNVMSCTQAATGFEHQRKTSVDVMKACGSLRNSPIKEASRSPSKASTMKSPSPMGKSPQPARQIRATSIHDTDQSPEVAMPVQACDMEGEAESQAMYENLKRMTKEQENAVPQTTLHATITEEDENCATISASDLSVKVAEAPSAPKTATKSDSRAKSSTQKHSRRTRDERKTPTSRNTPIMMDKYARSSKEERNPASRRAKYNTNNPCVQSLDVSGGSTPIQAEDKLSNNSTTARRAGLKKSLSSSQGGG